MKYKKQLLVCLLFACCTQCQLDSLILRPSPTIRRSPTDLGYTYETKTVSTPKNATISLWHVASSVDRKGIIVLIPGNDANKSRYVISLPLFADHGWDLVIPDYTGFGESPGPATLEGLFDSAFGAIDYAKSQCDVVIGYGISLGTGVLARVAAERDLTACIFESMAVVYEAPSLFAEFYGLGSPITDMADIVATLGSSPNFDTKRWITQVSEPKLFLHSPDDSVTPFQGAWEVFNLAPQPKHFFVTQGNHAMQPFMDPGLYRSVVNGWMDGIINQNPIENEQFETYLNEEIEAALGAFGLAPAQPATPGS